MARKSIRLSGGGDVFYGSDGNEDVYGMDGSDRLYGRGGDDRLFSNDENSFGRWLDGSVTEKSSFIDGGAGHDEIDSYATDFAVGIGGWGDDFVFARSLKSAYGYGGIGDDVLGVSGDHGQAYAHGGAGRDTITVWATHGYAAAYGDAGDDTLSIDRSVRGKLVGGDGDDLLLVDDATREQVTEMIGGIGRDIAQGDALGRERHVFAKDDTGVGSDADEVHDFAEPDVIDVSRIDANGRAPGDGRFTFVGYEANPDTGELGFYRTMLNEAPVTVVTFDFGSGDREIVLRFLQDPELTATDFVL